MNVSNCEECGAVLGHECSPGYPSYCSACVSFIENGFTEGAKRMTPTPLNEAQLRDRVQELETVAGKAIKRIAELEAVIRQLSKDPEMTDEYVLGQINIENKARIAELETELRKRGNWHLPGCRKMMYDISSSPCTCEFSFNEVVSISREKDKRIAELEDERDIYNDALYRIRNWAEAYPLDIFPEPDLKRARRLLENGGITLDAVSASNMRHVLKGVRKICKEALESGE